MGKMRGTKRMGHGPGKTSMRVRSSSMHLRGSVPGRASLGKVNASLNRGLGGESYAGSGISDEGSRTGGTIPVKLSNVKLGNS